MNPFFKSLLKHRDELSDLEQQVLNYFLEKPNMIETHTLQELSEEIFVSTATISRTCKKLGFSGFQEMKYSFLKYREENTNDIQEIPNKSSVNKQLKRFEEEMNTNLTKIGNGITDKLINQIKNSQHVEFFGVGSSLPVCIEAARKMTFAGRIATARSDWDELRVVAKNLTKSDLAIVISLSGETLNIVEYVNILKDNNVPIVAITGNEGSQLHKLADETLIADIRTTYYDKVDMSSRFPLNLIINLLVIELINREY